MSATEIPGPPVPAVTVRDVAMRDGLQIEEPISTQAKLELLDAIIATGVREVEVTAFVSPTKVPALADAADIAAHLDRFAGDADFSALVASVTGARRALDAGLRTLEYVVSASDAHSRANVGRGTDDSAALIGPVVDAAHEAGARVEVIVATAWDCPFDGPTPPDRVRSVIARAVADGADRISIADTIGTTTPRRVTDLIAEVLPLLDGHPLGAHFHNTRGTGLASAYAAVQSGLTRLDASAGGLGGCPFAPGASGNIATEDLVYLLRDSGIDTGIDLGAAIEAGRVAVGVTGGGPGSALMRAGDRKPR